MDKQLMYFMISLLIGITLFVTAIFAVKKDYTTATTQVDCEKNNSTASQGGACGAWYNNKCRTGKIDGSSCVSVGDYLPITLMSLGGLSVVVCVYFLYSYVKVMP
jgi:hypothetical protein